MPVLRSSTTTATEDGNTKRVSAVASAFTLRVMAKQVSVGGYASAGFAEVCEGVTAEEAVELHSFLVSFVLLKKIFYLTVCSCAAELQLEAI